MVLIVLLLTVMGWLLVPEIVAQGRAIRDSD